MNQTKKMVDSDLSLSENKHVHIYLGAGTTHAGQMQCSESVHHRLVSSYLSVPSKPHLDGAFPPSCGIKDGRYKKIEREHIRGRTS